MKRRRGRDVAAIWWARVLEHREIAYVPQSEIAAIEEFDEAIVQELRNVRATAAHPGDRDRGDDRGAAPAADLLEVEGMDEELAAELARHGIVTREDLADQAVDDLAEIPDLDRSEPVS